MEHVTTIPGPRTPSTTGPASPTGVVLLGSTGSIGTQALDVINDVNASAPTPAFGVLGLATGGGHLPLLAEQAVTHGVPVLAVADSAPTTRARLAAALEEAATRLGLPHPVRTVLAGPDAATELIEAAGAGPGGVVLLFIVPSLDDLPPPERTPTRPARPPGDGRRDPGGGRDHAPNLGACQRRHPPPPATPPPPAPREGRCSSSPSS